MQLSLATLALPGVAALAPHTLLAEAALTLLLLAGCCCCCCCGLLLGESPSMIGTPAAPDRLSCCSWRQPCRLLTGPPVDVARFAGTCLLTDPAALAGVVLAAAAPACQLPSDGPPRLELAWVLLALLLAAWRLPGSLPCSPVLRGVTPADAVRVPADTLSGCASTEPCAPL